MRHSLAHIMAAAVQKLWSKAKFGVGPVIEDGFYYDIDLGKDTLRPEDLPKIEDEMTEIINADLPFEQFDLDIEKAIKWAKDNKQDYKVELLNDLKTKGTTAVKDVEDDHIVGKSVDKISFYSTGDFEDLCRGPHVKSTGQVGAFKLQKIAGAYWRGNEKNPQLQRIYGAAFATQEEVDKHLQNLEEAERRDHRRMGQELDLFTFSDLVGKGLPLFTPRGTVLRDKLNQLSQGLRRARGYQRVWVPHIGHQRLYEASGHWEKFGEELFLVKSQETADQLVLKPMNCPHHAQIYASRPRSYRDLPVKYMETTTIYRDEKSGELHGLSRVRSVTQDDTHVFCTAGQIDAIVDELLEISQTFYRSVDLGLKIHLSFRDSSDKFLGDKKLWDQSQAILEKVAKANKLDYQIDQGEAAFYGPKIDMIAVDSLGREWQLATIQLDFVQPARFELEYTAEDGSAKTPVMIHYALMGSIERFLAVYLEHTGGRFPVWVAPEQVRLVVINDSKPVLDYAKKILEQLKDAGLRAGADLSNQTVSKKIRESEVMKVPYTLVVGDKEVKSGKVVPRVRLDMAVKHEERPIGVNQFIQTVVNEVKSHVHHSSL